MSNRKRLTNKTKGKDKDAPCWHTFPSRRNAEGKRLRRQHEFNAKFKIILQYIHREKWEKFKAEHSAYIANVKEECSLGNSRIGVNVSRHKSLGLLFGKGTFG